MFCAGIAGNLNHATHLQHTERRGMHQTGERAVRLHVCLMRARAMQTCPTTVRTLTQLSTLDATAAALLDPERGIEPTPGHGRHSCLLSTAADASITLMSSTQLTAGECSDARRVSALSRRQGSWVTAAENRTARSRHAAMATFAGASRGAPSRAQRTKKQSPDAPRPCDHGAPRPGRWAGGPREICVFLAQFLG